MKRLAKRPSARQHPMKTIEHVTLKLGLVIVGAGAVAWWLPLPRAVTGIILVVAGFALVFAGER